MFASQLLHKTLWRLEFEMAWKLLISYKVLKSTGANRQPIGLQLAIPEWHLRAAFENDCLVKVLVSTYKEVTLTRSMQRNSWCRHSYC